MTQRKHRPWLILILGTGFLALMAWSAYYASIKTSAVTDPDYYSHGLRYNETLLERKAAASLGWQTRIELTDQTLLVELADKGRQPVAQARGLLTLYARDNREQLQLEMVEQEPGRYLTQLPTDLTGEQTADISFERDGARLSKRLLFSKN